MNETAKLLQSVYENAAMGKDTVKHLLTVTEEKNIEELLSRQLADYSEISDKAREALEKRHLQAQKVGAVTKISSHLTIDAKLLRDRSASHMVRMLTQGCTMGITEMKKQLKALGKADADARRLGIRLLRAEEDQLEQLKRYF